MGLVLAMRGRGWCASAGRRRPLHCSRAPSPAGSADPCRPARPLAAGRFREPARSHPEREDGLALCPGAAINGCHPPRSVGAVFVRAQMAFRTSRTFTVRGRPPRLAGGISEPTSAHSPSVKSLSYRSPRRSADPRCSGFHMRHLPPTQVPHKERMARPVGKGVFVWLEQSASTYPVSGCVPRPRWRSAQPDPHNHSGLEGRSLFQVFKLPFDCQGRAHCQRPPPVPSHWSFRQKPQSARRGHAIRIAGRRSEPE